MNIRTDLAVERLDLSAPLPSGAACRELRLHGVPCTLVEICGQQAARAVGKPEGQYYTLSCTPFSRTPEDFSAEVEAVAGVIGGLLPREGTVLTVGLGNSSITPDALGPETVRLLLATRHIDGESAALAGLPGLRPAAAIAPGVLGQTGMETAEILSALVREIRPAAVIAVDALAAGDFSRLGATVQVSNSGISPGSGVANRRKELSAGTLGVPVVAVGVPTVVDYPGKSGAPMMVTPREVDVIIENAAKTIAFAINRALQPELSLEDLLALVN